MTKTSDIDDDAERDRVAGDILSEHMINKTVTEVVVADASCLAEDTCYGSITIKFSDGSHFIISEGGQAGYMEYGCFLPLEVTL